ncbi:hypothetical protein PTKIN_Ptkin14bG0157400 [Pterospermum kingtungense]
MEREARKRNVTPPSSNRSVRDWRANLFTVFIGQLSIRVSKQELWEVFNRFGRVVDVFIPSGKKRVWSSVSYAFVRYKTEREIRKAVQLGDGRLLDGRSIIVKKASFGWNARRRSPIMKRRSPTLSMRRSDALNNERDHRSYKEVVMGGIPEQSWNGEYKVVKGYESMEKIKGASEGANVAKQVQQTEVVPELRQITSVSVRSRNLEKGECSRLKREGTEMERESVVEFNQFIQDYECKWLFNCAIGRLKESVNVESIASSLKEKGLACQVCPAGGVSVLLKFESPEELKHFLRDHISLYEAWFDECKPWSKSGLQRNIPMWIVLQEVPLHLWDIKFFKVLGDSWGTFVDVDYNTACKSRFDRAKILVIVDNRFNIPSVVSIKNGDSTFKIMVSLDEDRVSDESPVERRVVAGKNLKGQTVEKGLLSKEQVPTSVDDSSWCLSKRANFTVAVTAQGEYSSQLSVTEMIGTSGNQNGEDASARLEDVEVGSPEPQSSFGPEFGMEMIGFEEGVSALAIVPWIGSNVESDSSVSDEEISNRNRVILREAERNVLVSSVLGFDFMRSNVQMVEVFEGMGMDDSRKG